MKHQAFSTKLTTTWNKMLRSCIRLGCIMIFVVFLFMVNTKEAEAIWPQIVSLKDGTLISYEVYGAGEPTLIFVHGWSCDARYWRNQVSPFSQNHKVVLIDLAEMPP